MTWFDLTCPSLTRQDWVWPNTTWFDLTWPSLTSQVIPIPDPVRLLHFKRPLRESSKPIPSALNPQVPPEVWPKTQFNLRLCLKPSSSLTVWHNTQFDPRLYLNPRLVWQFDLKTQFNIRLYLSPRLVWQSDLIPSLTHDYLSPRLVWQYYKPWLP